MRKILSDKKKFNSIVLILIILCFEPLCSAQGIFTQPATNTPTQTNNNQFPVYPPVNGGGNPSQANTPVQIEIAQRLLGRLGFLKEQPSGVMTSATSEAIRVFSYQQNLNTGGVINEQLLRTLRLVAWNTGAWKKGNLKGQDKLLDAPGIKEAQAYLVKLGFNPGPVDGTFGPQTQSSVEAFQSSQKTSIDGLISKTTLMNLKRSLVLPNNEVQGVVRILNWPDYIEPTVLEDFEKETKIKVIYDIYGSNEELESKLKSSSEPYDVVIPTASYISSLSMQGMLKPLDKAQLKNIANIDPKISAFMETWDPGSKYAIPYMWYTLGLAVNTNLTGKYLPAVNTESLSLIFDPNNARKLMNCGVRVVDSPSDIIPLAALYGGIKQFSNDDKSLAAAERVLLSIKNIVTPISNDEYIEALAQGKVCAAIAFSGDASQAKAAAKAGNSLQYKVPLEGGSFQVDTIAMSAQSKNVAQGLKFIDYLLRPKVIARISNTVKYANGNLNSRAYLDPSLLNDSGIIPTADVMKRLIFVPALTAKTREEIDRIWKEFAGK